MGDERRTEDGGSSRRRHGPFRLRTIVQLLMVAFVVHVFVIPQIGGARDALDTISGVSPALVVFAIALEVSAIVAYARLTQSLLPPEHRPGLSVCSGIVLASMGVNHVVPGGAATTAAVNYRLFGRAGVPGSELGFALATQAIGSAVVLNVILWVALVLSIPASGFHPIYATAAAIGAVLITLFSLTVIGLLRGRDRMAKLAGRLAMRIPRLDAAVISTAVERIADQLRELVADRRGLWVGLALAAANWLLDAAALWVFLAAFGHRSNVVGLLVAYSLANVLAAVPVTPGGLGVIEAVLIPALVGFGTPASTAAVGVVAYRLVNFWLPIPAGLAAYVVIERRLGGDDAEATPRPVVTALTHARIHPQTDDDGR